MSKANKRGWLLFMGILLCSPLHGSEVSHQRQTELLNLLTQDCGSCHGMTLKGGLGPPLTPAALEGKPREAMVATILNGREGTAMPPWGPLLKQSEVRWLVDQMYKGLDDAD